MIGADYSYVMGNMVQVAGRMIIVQQIPPPYVSFYIEVQSAGQIKGNICTLSYGHSDNCKTQAQVITTHVIKVVEGIKFSIHLSVYKSYFFIVSATFLKMLRRIS